MTAGKRGTRVLTIEWRHLDVGGDTCTRCSGTYANIIEAIRSLDRSGDLKGISVEVIDTPLPKERISESNMVLINGVPLEDFIRADVTYTECTSCADLVGAASCCRAVTTDGVEAETLPVEMIRDGILMALE